MYTMMRDSAWSYLRKYRLAHRTSTLEEQQQAAESAGYVFAHRLTPPAPETQFQCYDVIYQRLLQGKTLSLMEVRQLCTPNNVALHQDERFYDLADGSWYTREQHFVNEALATLLRQSPTRSLNLKDYLVEHPNGIFWTLDPCFQIVGEAVRLRVAPEELDSLELSTTRVWLQEWLTTDEQILEPATLAHPEYPTYRWQAHLQAALAQDERFIEIRPGVWCPVAKLPQAPSLDDITFLRLNDDAPIFETLFPPFPDPSNREPRQAARFRTTLGAVELRLGYIAVPGLWQSAFGHLYYPVTWKMPLGQTLEGTLWAEGGLLFGEGLFRQILQIGVGGRVLIEKTHRDRLVITVEGWDEQIVSLEGLLFTPEELRQAKVSTLWDSFQDGIGRTAPELVTAWEKYLGHSLTLTDYQAGFLHPGVIRDGARFRWFGIQWEAYEPYFPMPALTADQAEETLLDLEEVPTQEDFMLPTDGLQDLFLPLEDAITVEDELLADLFEPQWDQAVTLEDLPTQTPPEEAIERIIETPVELSALFEIVDSSVPATLFPSLSFEPLPEFMVLQESTAPNTPDLAELFIDTEPKFIAIETIPTPELLPLAPEPLIPLADLLEATVDVPLELDLVKEAPTTVYLLLQQQLTALAADYPQAANKPHWFSLLADLRQKTELTLPDLAMIEALWWGEYHQRQTALPQVIAQTQHFFCHQLPLTLLPLQGSLHEMRVRMQSLYDCGDRDPGYALSHLILPALGYACFGDNWYWSGLRK